MLKSVCAGKNAGGLHQHWRNGSRNGCIASGIVKRVRKEVFSRARCAFEWGFIPWGILERICCRKCAHPLTACGQYDMLFMVLNVVYIYERR